MILVGTFATELGMVQGKGTWYGFWPHEGSEECRRPNSSRTSSEMVPSGTGQFRMWGVGLGAGCPPLILEDPIASPLQSWWA